MSTQTENKTSEPSIDNHELKLPFTLSEKLFFAFTSFIAIYEILFWLIFDFPITLHSKGQTPIYLLGISASLNSIPHLFCGTWGLIYITRSYRSAALLLITQYKHNKQLKKLSLNNKLSHKDKQQLISRHKKELKKLPIYQKGGLRFSIYVLYVSLFTLMQIYFWWLPYFFGIVSDNRFAKMKHKLDGIVSILPSNDKYLVPSAEHTILFPISVITWILSIQMFLKYRAVIITQVRNKKTNYFLLASFSAVICYLPTSMSNIKIKKQGENGKDIIENINDVGAAIIAAMLVTVNILFFIALFWSPNYKKATAAAQSKKNK